MNELVPAGRASRRESAPVEQKLVTGRDGDAHWRGGLSEGSLVKVVPRLAQQRTRPAVPRFAPDTH